MAISRIPDQYYSSQKHNAAPRDRTEARRQIAADTATFERLGGRVQVLGNTDFRRKDLGDDPTTVMPPDRAPSAQWHQRLPKSSAIPSWQKR
ncbi:MAG TPA: hypothetical protein VGD21_02345 [Lysobacter sp.]